MKSVIALLFLLLVVPPLQARTAKRNYSFPCDAVWKAAVEVASQKPYRLQIQNERDRELMVQTGSYWVSGERSISLRLTAKGTGCEGIANGPFAGFAHRDTKDFLDRIAARLEAPAATREPESAQAKATPPAPQPATPPVAAEAKAPATQSKSPTSGQEGKVAVASKPTGADVYVDQAFVGDTPATLMISPGKHTIRVTLLGYEEWKRDLVVTAGSSVSLDVALKK